MTKLLFVCGSARKASTAYAIEEAKRAAEAVEDGEVDVLYLHGKKNRSLHGLQRLRA